MTSRHNLRVRTPRHPRHLLRPDQQRQGPRRDRLIAAAGPNRRAVLRRCLPHTCGSCLADLARPAFGSEAGQVSLRSEAL
eukprot:scaffold388_cov380-Prasinococcus_capsulatus_cf.AAC.12